MSAKLYEKGDTVSIPRSLESREFWEEISSLAEFIWILTWKMKFLMKFVQFFKYLSVIQALFSLKSSKLLEGVARC